MPDRSAYKMIQSDAFALHDLCEITMTSAHKCLFFNDPEYISKSIVKSKFVEKLWTFISLPTCEKHPLTQQVISNVKKFDLPHLTTYLQNSWKDLPGIRMNDYKKDHKWTTVNFELKFWATVGQLKLLSEDYIKSLHIVVHSPIGKMEL